MVPRKWAVPWMSLKAGLAAGYAKVVLIPAFKSAAASLNAPNFAF